MAYDKIIPVRSRLDRCVDYVLNREKTDLAAVLGYIGNEDKNVMDGAVLETALNCSLETAYQDMTATKQRWGKPGGVLGYHLIHSYAPGEVTPRQAHELGVEFARRVLGDKYEAVISTHLSWWARPTQKRWQRTHLPLLLHRLKSRIKANFKSWPVPSACCILSRERKATAAPC